MSPVKRRILIVCLMIERCNAIREELAITTDSQTREDLEFQIRRFNRLIMID